MPEGSTRIVFLSGVFNSASNQGLDRGVDRLTGRPGQAVPLVRTGLRGECGLRAHLYHCHDSSTESVVLLYLIHLMTSSTCVAMSGAKQLVGLGFYLIEWYELTRIKAAGNSTERDGRWAVVVDGEARESVLFEGTGGHSASGIR